MKLKTPIALSCFLIAGCGSSMEMSGQQGEIEAKVSSVYSDRPNMDDRSRDGITKTDAWNIKMKNFEKTIIDTKAENWSCTAADRSDAASYIKKYPQNKTGVIDCFGILDQKNPSFSRFKVELEIPQNSLMQLGDVFSGDKFVFSVRVSYFSATLRYKKPDYTTRIQISSIKLIK